MEKKISNMELSVITYFISRAFFIGVTFDCLIKIIKQDSWLIPLINIFVCILIIFIIDYIMKYKPNLNIFEKLNALFKSKLIIIIIILIGLCFCTLNYLNLNNFVHSQFLNKTPLIVTSIAFIIATIYILNLGLNCITKTSIILFYLNILLIITTFFSLFSNYNIANIKPFFQFNYDELSKSLLCFFSFNISPLFLITVIPKNMIHDCKTKRALSLGCILSCLTLFLVIFETLSTFGYELAKLYQYPEFHILKNISVLGLSSRIESILVIQWLFDLLLYNVFILYFISMGIKCLTKNTISIKIINLCICAFLVFSTGILSNYNIFLNNLILNYSYIPITIVTILLLVIICLKIKISY